MICNDSSMILFSLHFFSLFSILDSFYCCAFQFMNLLLQCLIAINPIQCIFDLRHYCFHLQKFDLGSLKYQLNFLDICNAIYTICFDVLLCCNSNMCQVLVDFDYCHHWLCFLSLCYLVIFTYMPDIVSFTLSQYFYIPISCLIFL